MRIHVLLAGAMGLALAGASTAQAQSGTSWGPKHTTYWNSDSTGKHEPGAFMTPGMPMAQPATMQQDMRAPVRPQRMYYQAPGKKVRAQMRLRQQQPGMKPGAPPEGAEQPPNVKPSAPPSRGQQPPQGDQPPQGEPPARGQTPQGQPK